MARAVNKIESLERELELMKQARSNTPSAFTPTPTPTAAAHTPAESEAEDLTNPQKPKSKHTDSKDSDTDDTIVTPLGEKVPWNNQCEKKQGIACVPNSIKQKQHVPLYTAQVLGHDALRMRLRRLCEVKPSGRCYVDDTTRSDYANLERREWLELALCDALKKHGTDRKDFKKIRVGGLITSNAWNINLAACMHFPYIDHLVYRPTPLRLSSSPVSWLFVRRCNSVNKRSMDVGALKPN